MEAVCRAVGVKRVFTIDPKNVEELKEAIVREIATREPSVIIALRKCVLIKPVIPVKAVKA